MNQLHIRAIVYLMMAFVFILFSNTQLKAYPVKHYSNTVNNKIAYSNEPIGYFIKSKSANFADSLKKIFRYQYKGYDHKTGLHVVVLSSEDTNIANLEQQIKNHFPNAQLTILTISTYQTISSTLVL